MSSTRFSARAKPLVMGVLLLAASGERAPAFAADPKPNILFLFADDQSHEMVGGFGNPEVQTPNLDRLARGGLVFTHAYNMGSWSGAVCVASRTMLNTGRFVWRAREIYDRSEQERREGRWWSEYLKQAGYETYFTGKWHVKADANAAFDHVRHERPGMPNQTAAGYDRPVEGQPDPWNPSDPSFGGYWEGGKHWSEVVGDDAVAFLGEASGRASPFFMYVAFNAPHDPRQSPREYVNRYPAAQVRVPDNYLPEYPYKDGIGCGPGLRDERLAPFPRTRHAVQVNRQEYMAITTHMDAQVGRILDALERIPQAGDTWVFFTADHGLAVGHHGLMGKQNQYDHSVRVPFIVKGPGVAPGQRRSARIYLQDVMPTTLELAGVERPAHVEFHSLVPLIRGETDRSPYPAIYGAYLEAQRMVTSGDFKLILYPQLERARLYNLKLDPLEMDDLAGNPSEQGTVHRLFRTLLGLQRQTGDRLDLRSAFPALAAESSL